MNFARTESFKVRREDEKLWECRPFVITPALVHFEVRQRRCRWQRITHCVNVIGRLIGCRSKCCHYRYRRLNIAQTRTLLWTAVCSWLPRLQPSPVAKSGSSSSIVLVRHCAGGCAGIVCQIKFPRVQRAALFHVGSQMPGTVLEVIEFYDSRLRLHWARMLLRRHLSALRQPRLTRQSWLGRLETSKLIWCSWIHEPYRDSATLTSGRRGSPCAATGTLSRLVIAAQTFEPRRRPHSRGGGDVEVMKRTFDPGERLLRSGACVSVFGCLDGLLQLASTLSLGFGIFTSSNTVSISDSSKSASSLGAGNAL